MNATAKIMYGFAAFLGIVSVFYIFITLNVQDAGNLYLEGAGSFNYEWAGGVAMILATIFALMLGGYLQITDRHADVLPEDWEEAEISDGAGTLGFFSPHSIWPFAMSLAVLVLGLGVIYLHWWLIAFGAVLLIWTTTMLNLQYGMPKEKH
ncbi:aa3-type cytochrome oxidase subunit IV [Corynebacterium sp. ZY180755]|jgi:hypothetical protein